MRNEEHHLYHISSYKPLYISPTGGVLRAERTHGLTSKLKEDQQEPKLCATKYRLIDCHQHHQADMMQPIQILAEMNPSFLFSLKE